MENGSEKMLSLPKASLERRPLLGEEEKEQLELQGEALVSQTLISSLSGVISFAESIPSGQIKSSKITASSAKK